MDLRKIASIYIEQYNLSVTPVKGKRPIIKDWTNFTGDTVLAENFEDQWLLNATGLGLLCGKASDLICLDIDILPSDEHLSEFLAELEAKLPPILLGRIGNPLKPPARFFRYNGEKARKFNELKVELLSDGNQVLMPPSIHPDTGDRYKWADKKLSEIDLDDIPLLPDGLLDWLEEKNNERKSRRRQSKSIKPTPQRKGAAVSGHGNKEAALSKESALTPVSGRCHSGSHNFLSAFILAKYRTGLSFDQLVKAAINYDKKVNSDADFFYFNCPSRKWRSSDLVENAKTFVQEIFDRHPHEQGMDLVGVDVDKPVDDVDTEWPTPLNVFDSSLLPKRKWIYGTDFIRGYISVVASAGGIGKTSNAIVEALSICTGQKLLDVDVKEPCNVWIINLEDPLEELQKRTLAAMKHYSINKDQIDGKLFVDGEDTISFKVANESRDGIKLEADTVKLIIKKIIEKNIGVVIIDPFVSTHTVNENNNASIQAVVAEFRRIARETNSSICLVHHVRKGNGENVSVDSIRGANALIGAARAVRVMSRLCEKEASRLGISTKEAKTIFKIEDGKANLAPPLEDSIYRKMIGVKIDNGEYIGVAVEYSLPDSFDNMTTSVINEILDRIDRGVDGCKYTASRASKDRWVGLAFKDIDAVNWKPKSDNEIKVIVKTWLRNGLLVEEEYYDNKHRKTKKGLFSTSRVGKVGEVE